MTIESLAKTFRTRRHDEVVALDGIDVEVPDGAYMVFLGPSGSGKTTALRCIAGLETPHRGRITSGDRVLVDVEQGIRIPPEQRGLAMVFQNYALWPHMTVEKNVGFGLRMMGERKLKSRDSVDEALRAVGLTGYGHRRINELSGGQMQRVGLARAMAVNPPVILMDEPLSNLDPAIRIDLRDELRTLHQSTGRTTLHVTHDQEEALFLADIITVFRNGRIEQSGAVDELRRHPVSAFVAGFLGWRNRFPASINDSILYLEPPNEKPIALGSDLLSAWSGHVGGAQKGEVAIHPDGIHLNKNADDTTGGGAVQAVVEAASYYSGWQAAGTVVLKGSQARLHFRTSGSILNVASGQTVNLTFDPEMVRVFPRDLDDAPSAQTVEPAEVI